jgi:hypothetical protein
MKAALSAWASPSVWFIELRDDTTEIPGFCARSVVDLPPT